MIFFYGSEMRKAKRKKGKKERKKERMLAAKNKERKVCFLIFFLWVWDEKGEKEGKKKKKEIKNWCLPNNRERRELYRKKSGKKKKKKKRGEWSQKLQLVGPSMCVYLQDCHHNFVSITWKHLKCVFSFHNSSLKNQRIEWWKQNLKTNPNKLSLCGPTIFELWVIKIELWVMEIQKPRGCLVVFFFFFSHHSSFNFRHSSLITHYLKYPNFLYPPLGTLHSTSHHSNFSTFLWDPYL